MARFLHRNVLGGLCLFLFGLVFFSVARGYNFGTPSRMGPGYFPTIVSALTMGLGVLVALSRPTEALEEHINWRPLLCVGLGILAFALGFIHLGLMPAVFLAVVVSSAGDRNARIPSTLLCALLLALGMWLLFVVGLGLPLPAVRGVF